MDILSFLIMVAYILITSLKDSVAVDSIGVSQSISDGKTLVSQGGKFELGFFSPGNSNKRYLGIWYKNIPVYTYVWVANGANPINGFSAILTLNSTGNLVLTQNGSVVWHTTTQKQAQNPVAELLDSGNLVVRNEGEINSEEQYLWQSFDYPTGTLLPGMKLGWNLQNGMEWRLTSWRSEDDPSPGDVSWGLLLHNYPEFYLTNETYKYYRMGPWNGLYFSGLPDQKPQPYYDFKYVTKNDFNFATNKDEMFYTYSVQNKSTISRVTVVGLNGFRIYLWAEDEQSWEILELYPKDFCDIYGACGAYADCSINDAPPCQCLKGFSPKSPLAWNSKDWSQGCIRNKPLSCNDKHTTDGFVKFVGLKVPETTHTWVDEASGLDECRNRCLSNCSCTAYTNSDIRGACSGCVMWFGDLIDIRKFEAGGQDLHIRMPASELEPETGSKSSSTAVVSSKKKTRTIVATTIPVISAMLLLGIYFICRFRRNNAENSMTEENIERLVDDLDLPLFDLPIITNATNDFLLENKIGEGGFGPVYRVIEYLCIIARAKQKSFNITRSITRKIVIVQGKLTDGREIAVKRLSRRSGQGMIEFLNEVKLIAKLQHRNLVKLIGCCIQGQEKLLIYEYMANGSLDSFIFGMKYQDNID